MNRLREFQQTFLDALVTGAENPAAGAFTAAAVSVSAGLAIYRNNVFAALTGVLGDLYPVVKRLVGDGFFAYAANDFVEGHPPRSPVLGDYGEGFPAFLDGFEPAASVPYLGDVARLELARHQALIAPDAEPLNAAAFRDVPSEVLSRIRIRFHPSCRLIRSPWPIEAIRVAHEDGAEPSGPIDVSGEETCLLIGRPGTRVETLALPPTAFDLAEQLRAGDALAEAYAATGGGWNPQATLTELLVFGAFVDFSLAEEET